MFQYLLTHILYCGPHYEIIIEQNSFKRTIIVHCIDGNERLFDYEKKIVLGTVGPTKELQLF